MKIWKTEHLGFPNEHLQRKCLLDEIMIVIISMLSFLGNMETHSIFG